MGSYRVAFKSSAEKELRAIPKPDIRRIAEKISALAEEPRPRGCEKLSGQRRYRLRQGNWRIVYEISDESRSVLIFKIGHRREVYR